MIIEKLSTAATFGGSGTAIMFGLTPSEWSVVGVIVGIIVAVLGLLANVYFKLKHLELAERKLQADPDA